MLYPLFFDPIYKNTLWGGRNFENIFNRRLPEGNIAESWELCCHKSGRSIVINGPLRGKSLEELTKEYGVELLGSKFASKDTFPLLIKFLDANDRLSVQVHPDNDYGLRVEGELGKTEMWYIVDAKENAKLVYCIKPGVTRDKLREAISNGSLEGCLNFVPIKKGDMIFIPSGTVHAILEGIIIAEIQQNSDITYRLYDWGRVDTEGRSRELHIDKALDVINFNFGGQIKSHQPTIYDNYELTKLVQCEYFNVDKIKINATYLDKTTPESMHIYTTIEGQGTLTHNTITYTLPPGTTFLLPASLGEYTIEGNTTLLKTYL